METAGCDGVVVGGVVVPGSLVVIAVVVRGGVGVVRGGVVALGFGGLVVRVGDVVTVVGVELSLPLAVTICGNPPVVVRGGVVVVVVGANIVRPSVPVGIGVVVIAIGAVVVCVASVGTPGCASPTVVVVVVVVVVVAEGFSSSGANECSINTVPATKINAAAIKPVNCHLNGLKTAGASSIRFSSDIKTLSSLT